MRSQAQPISSTHLGYRRFLRRHTLQLYGTPGGVDDADGAELQICYEAHSLICGWVTFAEQRWVISGER
jgi:hypothetical protein